MLAIEFGPGVKKSWIVFRRFVSLLGRKVKNDGMYERSFSTVAPFACKVEFVRVKDNRSIVWAFKRVKYRYMHTEFFPYETYHRINDVLLLYYSPSKKYASIRLPGLFSSRRHGKRMASRKRGRSARK